MRSPLPLKPGDKVAITAPASRVYTQDLVIGIANLESWRLQVIVGNTVGNSHFNFSDTLQNRLQELQSFLDDKDVKCILAARGGYGVSDLLDQLDFSSFLENPKWVCGFSDLTALVLHINSLGIQAIHGPMAKTLSFDKESNKYLYNALFGSDLTYTFANNSSNKLGIGNGTAIGGNLVMLCHCVGSNSDVSYAGKILFIEDVGEKLYSIDRLMVQLKRAGKLKGLAGLVVGDFSETGEEAITFGETAEEIIIRHTAEYSYPVSFGFPFGHEKQNWPIIMGGQYELEVLEGKSLLKFVRDVII